MTSSKNNYKDVLEKYIGSRLKQVDDAFKSKWVEMDKELEPFINSLDKLGDRELVILSASLLDDYLEIIITASYIKDERVKSIFKDENVLQSFYTKINVAYFSGLIPKWLFNDLRLICEIRNKFAHKFLVKLELTDEAITTKIDKCELRPKTLDGVKAPRLKFIIVVTLAAALLKAINAMLIYDKPQNFVDIIKMNEWDYEKMALTKDEIREMTDKTSSR